MNLLQLALTTLWALVFLDYNKGGGDIIFAIDASVKRWGEVLIQFVKEKKHLSRYKSKISSSAEKKYDTFK